MLAEMCMHCIVLWVIRTLTYIHTYIHTLHARTNTKEKKIKLKEEHCREIHRKASISFPSPFPFSLTRINFTLGAKNAKFFPFFLFFTFLCVWKRLFYRFHMSQRAYLVLCLVLAAATVTIATSSQYPLFEETKKHSVWFQI